MFGFVIGTICLVMLFKMARMRRRVYAAGCGVASVGPGWGGHGGWHAHRWQSWRGGWEGGFGGGRSFWMRGVLERLQTTPGQEKAIVAAVEEARETLKSLRGEVELTRQDLARAFTAPSFDAELVGHTFARHDEAIETARKAAIGALAKIHDVLDERQRAELAALIEKGPRFGFHPYR